MDVMAVTSLYWIFIFGFFDLYRSWKASSRFDEFVNILKGVTFGSVILFIMTFDMSHPLPRTRVVLFIYWFILVLTVSLGRIAIRTFQRRILIKGIGLSNSIIVGNNEKGLELLREVRKYPALGFRVVGIVSNNGADSGEIEGMPILGNVEDLPRLIEEHKVESILIAVSSSSHEEILGIISACSGCQVTFNIVPDLYDIVSGHVRTNQIYGFPLMELLPDLMPPWEKKVKRALDMAISIVVLVGALPIWLLVAVAIKLDSRGPVLLAQERVGKNWKPFKMYKFRSMVEDAEKKSGPVWAKRNDPRVTKVGRIIRKLHVDEVPQFFNILGGDMSLVGPRPERTFFVEKLRKEIPLYEKRLNVPPGLTGWAQTKGRYDRSLDDVRNKLKYDLYYIENMSLRMDLKILLRTLWTILRPGKD